MTTTAAGPGHHAYRASGREYGRLQAPGQPVPAYGSWWRRTICVGGRPSCSASSLAARSALHSSLARRRHVRPPHASMQPDLDPARGPRLGPGRREAAGLERRRPVAGQPPGSAPASSKRGYGAVLGLPDPLKGSATFRSKAASCSRRRPRRRVPATHVLVWVWA
jgi:hypothetical protein